MTTPLFVRLHDVVLAVNDVSRASHVLAQAFGVAAGEPVTVLSPGIEATHRTIRIGEQQIVVMGDATGNGPVSRFLKKRGEGLFTAAIEVSDLEAAMAQMKAAGVTFVKDTPTRLEGWDYSERPNTEVWAAWIHPKSAFGLSLELQEIRPR